MSPHQHIGSLPRGVAGGKPPEEHNSIVLEACTTVFGGMVIMAGITIANMRRGVLLHKLILLELCIGGWQSFNLFFPTPTYGWWLSSAAVGLHISSQLHSTIAWLKLRPFLTRRSSLLFIGTLLLVQPYWGLEMYATFAYFNNINEWLFLRTRPIETLFRDPWWVASCAKLLWVLKSHYDLTLREVVMVSPRFAVMLAAMVLSLTFVILDILSVTATLKDALPVGVNPFWKLALVFKCLTDTVILDDFKTALDRLWLFRRTSLAAAAADGESRESGAALVGPYVRQPSSERGSNEGRKGNASNREYAEHVSFVSSPRLDLPALPRLEALQPPLPLLRRT